MPEADTEAGPEIPAGSSREWNFHPALPIDMSPVFDLPPKPKATAAWLLGTWTKLSPPVSHMVFALIVYLWVWPAMVQIQAGGTGWMLQILTANLSAALILGTSLHLYLYTFSGQKTRLKYDLRPMEKNARFTFGNQVWDNLYWGLVWGVPIWSAWMILYFHLGAQGWVPMLDSVAASPIWFIAFFFVIRFWQSFHFYWVHRLIHMPFLFKTVHHVHHRNINTGPWSGLSMHPVELLLYFSGILIHFVLPSHPIHVIFHMFSLSLGALYSHSGFAKLLIRDREAMNAGSFHHQLHHRYFECNYGSEEMPLDRWFHSFHDGTPEATKRIRARKKLIFARK